MAGVIQEISSGKNNKNRDILNALPLCMILVAGSILSWFKIAAIDLVFEAAAFGIAEIVLCLTAVYGLLSSKDKKWAFFIPAAGAAVLTFIRPVQILNGFLSFLNICIYSWNEKYEDGVRLFGNVQATEQNLFLYSLVFLLILAALLWYSDQPDRPRSVCSGDRLRTFFPFWSRSYAHFHYRCMAVCLSCWLFRTPYRLDDRNRTDPFFHALDIRRKNLTDSTESEKGRSTDDRTAAIWRG